jgi:hypothetical protein
MLAKIIIANAESLYPFVRLEQCALRGKVYTINKQIPDDVRHLLQECKDFVSEKLSSEMRNGDTKSALKSCKDVTSFVKKLLKSNVESQLVIALFNELNIFGYMADRHSINYRLCSIPLTEFLDHVDHYKDELPEPQLEIWNNSTYGGADQIPFFRAHIKKMMDN